MKSKEFLEADTKKNHREKHRKYYWSTHSLNKPFKGKMHAKMDGWLDTEDYELTKSGKIKPAPYKKICDWVGLE